MTSANFETVRTERIEDVEEMKRQAPKFVGQTYLEPNINLYKETRGRGGLRTLRRIARITKKYVFDTQKIREQLISDLQALEDLAYREASDKRKKGEKTEKGKREWARLAAYISQTINSIAKEYDVVKIKAKLEELQRLVERELGEGSHEA